MWALSLIGFAVLCILTVLVALAATNFLEEKKEKLGFLHGFLFFCLCVGFSLAQLAVMFIAGPVLLQTTETFVAGMFIWIVVMCWPMQGLANPYG